MKTSSEYRAAALSLLSGKWNAPVIYTLVFVVVACVVAGVTAWIPFVGGILASFVILPLAWAFVVTFLRNYRAGNEFAVMNLIEGYQNDFKRLFCTLGLKYIYTYLWTLLFIIPGIIKGYSYALTEYILEDNKEIENNAAIEKSMAMMEGHKMELFLLDLSFLGWYLLALLTCGIGLLWVMPYQYTARAAFYEDLKAETAAPAMEVVEA